MSDEGLAVTEQELVVPAEAQAPETAPAEDLDAILSEFDAKTKQSPAEAATEPRSPDEIAWIKQQLEDLRTRVVGADVRAGLDDTIKRIRSHAGDALSFVGDDVIEDLLQGEAARDPRLGVAFANRGSDPKAWDRAVRALGDRIKSKFKVPDQAVTSARAAMVAATRGVLNDGPKEKAPDVTKMSPKEFREYERKLLGR